MRTNDLGQPVGDSLDSWSQPDPPGRDRLEGRTVRLEPLSAGYHASDLWSAFAEATDDLWTYMDIGPFGSYDDMHIAVAEMAALADLVPFAICVDGQARGFACFMRIDPPNGVIEIGSIAFAPTLQRTVAATEAIYLMLEYVFGLGYRRCEWKCDDLNAPSRAAAVRLGFIYEGTFRSAIHYKGRNRDTAWYATIDSDWRTLRAAFEAWLAPDNFDPAGVQRQSLSHLRLKAN